MSPTRPVLALVLVVPLLFACGGKDTAAPVALGSFCDAWTTAVCAAAERCGCADAAPSLADCRAAALPACPLAEGGATGMALAAGDLTYDPNAAGAWLARVKGADCDLTNFLHGLGPGDVIDMAGTVDGTAPAGASCTPAAAGAPDACQHGQCSMAGTCVAWAGTGEACDATHVCESPVEAAPDATLFCGPDGTCQLPLADGAACTASTDCRSGNCAAGTCAPKVALGDGCTEDGACDSTFCNASTGRCSAPQADGTLCTTVPQCMSGWCANRLDLGAGMCKTKLTNGEACTGAVQCASGACVAGACAPMACGMLAP